MSGDVEVIPLHRNKWISLLEMRAPEHGVEGYVYAHYTRATGFVVSLLPYRIVSGSGGPFNSSARIEFLLRSEVTPCWDLYNQTRSAITGGCEWGVDFSKDAIRELEEEGGYKVGREELIPLGRSYGTKFTDTVYVLYSVDLSGKEQGPILGDGSSLEASATSVWVPAEELIDVQDPHVAVMYLRLHKMLWEQR